MKHSTDRILTTFVGSLARPPELLEMMYAREHGQPYDQAAYAGQVRRAVADVVRRQVEAGVDIVCDGEQGKSGFFTYVSERLAGFEPRETTSPAGPWAGSREALAFPDYYQWYARGRPGPSWAGSGAWHQRHRRTGSPGGRRPGLFCVTVTQWYGGAARRARTGRCLSATWLRARRTNSRRGAEPAASPRW